MRTTAKHLEATGTLGRQERAVMRTVLVDATLAALPFMASLAAVLLTSYSEGVIRFLIGLLFVTSALLAIRFVRRGFQHKALAAVAVALGFVIWYSYPGIIFLFRSDRWFGDILPLYIENRTVTLSIMYLSLYFFVWVLTYGLLYNQRQHVLPVASTSQASISVAPKTIAIIATAGVLVGAAPYLLSGMSFSDIFRLIFESRAVEKPWLFTENLGNRASAFVYLAQSLWVASTCLLWAVTQDARVKLSMRFLLGGLAFISTTIIFFDQGTRSITALILVPVLLLFMLKHLPKSRWTVVAGVAAALALVLVFQFQLLFRSEQTRAEVTDDLMTDLTTLRGTSDYFSENLLAVQIVPGLHDYFKESVLVQFIVSPIPRFIWANKPTTQVVWFYSLIRWGIDIYEFGGNIFPGVVGQFYMSWGWIGVVILGVLFGWICARVDRWLRDSDPTQNPYHMIIALMLAVWLLLSYRILSPGFFYPILFAWIIVYLIQRASNRTRPPFKGRAAKRAHHQQAAKQDSISGAAECGSV